MISRLIESQSNDNAPVKDAFITMTVNLVGGLLPIIIGFVIFQAFSKWQGQWTVFYRNGEFYLYAAAFLTPAAFIFYKNKKRHYDLHSWMFWLMVLVIFLTGMLFALLRVAQDVFRSNVNFSASFLSITSYAFLAYSVFMMFWSLVLQNTREPDLNTITEGNVASLNKQFDKL
jgi:hypothetical protein